MSAAARRWVGDERLAQLAWSRLAEPEDSVAMSFVAGRGAGPALDRLLSAAPVTAGEQLPDEGAAALQQGLERWRTRLPETDPVRDLDAVHALGGRAVLPGDPQWPPGLDDLEHLRPFALWVRGPADPAAACARSVALVGARAATAYGERVAAELAAGAGDRGVTTVSGAALGIDGAAHRGALAVGAPTVAVLACGVDRAYPMAHDRLLSAIAEAGAVISEVPPGSSPMKRRFLQRNRLIAAASSATVVVEAGWRSGALATARRALDLSRPVGAVPGPVTSPASAGCHELMRSAPGVVCVTDAQEVAQLAGPLVADQERSGPPRPHDGLDQAAAAVLDALPVRSGRPAARLAAVAGLPEAQVAGALRRLSRRGLAVRDGGGWRRGGLEPGEVGR